MSVEITQKHRERAISFLNSQDFTCHDSCKYNDYSDCLVVEELAEDFARLEDEVNKENGRLDYMLRALLQDVKHIAPQRLKIRDSVQRVIAHYEAKKEKSQ